MCGASLSEGLQTRDALHCSYEALKTAMRGQIKQLNPGHTLDVPQQFLDDMERNGQCADRQGGKCHMRQVWNLMVLGSIWATHCLSLTSS